MTQPDKPRCETCEARLKELLELRAFRDRIMWAVGFAPPTDQTARNNAIAADLLEGLSLRRCAAKHGTTVAIVRGIARHQQPKEPTP